VAQAGARIAVMPGGGVRSGNVAALVARTGAREVHLSASAFREGVRVTDGAEVAAVLAALRPQRA
jgi:copper homeostasis protein